MRMNAYVRPRANALKTASLLKAVPLPVNKPRKNRQGITPLNRKKRVIRENVRDLVWSYTPLGTARERLLRRARPDLPSRPAKGLRGHNPARLPKARRQVSHPKTAQDRHLSRSLRKSLRKTPKQRLQKIRKIRMIFPVFRRPSWDYHPAAKPPKMAFGQPRWPRHWRVWRIRKNMMGEC